MPVKNRLFDILQGALRGEVLADEPLADHTTWRIGGPADLFIRPADPADLVQALRMLRDHRTPWLVLGGGSNLLVRDGGFRGAVLHLGRFNQVAFQDAGLVTAGAGLELMSLIRLAVQRGLGGLESLAGIPGTVGGSVAMNAGAAGTEIGSFVQSMLLAGADGCEEWPAVRLEFGYRRCTLPADRLIIEARLQLPKADPSALEREIDRRLHHRREAQGVAGPNAGSVFKNPPGESAWQLIDRAGLRGETIGKARVSEQHSNFIVNLGGATAEDVLTLIGRIQEQVEEKTGIRLETEVRIMGSPKAR
jgi:UDP-N-acetylmuramate dehydrogenase